jgi:conserved oligomeric Golgi complex subunit 3
MKTCSRRVSKNTCEKQLSEPNGCRANSLTRLYRDQLALTERHLESLINDTNGALKLLTNLSNSFKAVELQTTSFQAQCEDLLSEQSRLQKLADEVGTDLRYYTYLDNVTRRLNAPGAGRLVDGLDFPEVLRHLDSCIAFMSKHVSALMSSSLFCRLFLL